MPPKKKQKQKKKVRFASEDSEKPKGISLALDAAMGEDDDDDGFLPASAHNDASDGEDDDGNHGLFLQQLGSLEGKPRFLHAPDDSSGGAGVPGAGAVSLEQMLQGVQGEKALKKDLVLGAKKDKQKKKKRKKPDENDDEDEKDGAGDQGSGGCQIRR